MIVYVETNFILELAYLQEEHEACESLLGMAEAGKLVMATPAFSVSEARMSLTDKAKKLRHFYDSLIRQLRELGRSKPHATLFDETKPLLRAVEESASLEKNRLEQVVVRLLKSSRVIPMQLTTAQKAIQVESAFELSCQDALVLASILEDLDKGENTLKCFLNRNSKDFANPDISAELATHACKMIPSFNDGLQYVLGALPG